MRRGFLLAALACALLLLTSCQGERRDRELVIEVLGADGFGAYVLDIATPRQEYDDPEYLADHAELYERTRALSLYEEGDLVATVTQGRLGVTGDMLGAADGGKRVHRFVGEGVPGEFRVLFQAGNEIRVSGVVTTDQRSTRITYDAKANVAHVAFSFADGMIGLLVRWVLMVALMMLVAVWQYRIRRWNVVLGVAMGSKLALNIALACAYPYSLFVTFLALMAAELVLIPIEYALLYALLKDEDASVLRRTVAVTGALCALIAVLGYLLWS